MNKNTKRAQAPKRINRHDSKIMGKKSRTGVNLSGPRTRDDRAANSMALRTGIWEA